MSGGETGEGTAGTQALHLSSADTIHGIDTGKCHGYNRILFVSCILKGQPHAGHDEVEIVQKAVDLISGYNAKMKNQS